MRTRNKQLKHFGKERSARRGERGRRERKERRGCNSLVKY